MKNALEKFTPQQLECLQAVQEATGKLNGPGSNPHTCSPAGHTRPSPDMVPTWLLDREQQQALVDNPVDCFYLLAAAQLLAGLNSNGHGGRADIEVCVHGITAELIDAGTMTHQQAAILNRICRQVCEPEREGESDNPKADTAGGESVNADLLVAVLRLARELDLASESIMDLIYRRSPFRHAVSYADFRNSYSVVMIGPHAYISGAIRVKISCSHPESHRLLKHHERFLQRLLQWYNGRVRPRFLYTDIVFDIEPRGYEPVDMKFSVDSSAALQLFTGNRLYADKRVFLRELIQNAVDACSFRKIGDDLYKPEIAILFNDDISQVTVRDNGIGMDRQWIEKYFLNIGISFYKSGEVRGIQRRTSLDFSFISQFGIGFLSSFLVSEKIVIRTRKADSRGLRIAISDLKDYFHVRFIGDDCPIGTEVTLHLKPSGIKYCRSLEYAGYLKTHIRFLRYPVKLVDENGTESRLGCEPLSYDAGEAKQPIFTAAMKFDDAEGYLQLKAKDLMGKLYALESARGGISIFQDGIFVTQVDKLLPEGARQNIVGRINLRGQDRCELSMDRNRIFWTKQELNAIRRAVRHGLVEVVNALVATMATQELKMHTHRSLINHVAIFFDFNELDDTMHRALCEPVKEVVEKRFRDFVRIHYAHTLRRNGISESSEYVETWQQTILEQFVTKN